MTKFLNVTWFRENEDDEQDIDGPIFINVNHITWVKRTEQYATRIHLSDGTWIDVMESMMDIQTHIKMAR